MCNMQKYTPLGPKADGKQTTQDVPMAHSKDKQCLPGV